MALPCGSAESSEARLNEKKQYFREFLERHHGNLDEYEDSTVYGEVSDHVFTKPLRNQHHL